MGEDALSDTSKRTSCRPDRAQPAALRLMSGGFTWLCSSFVQTNAGTAGAAMDQRGDANDNG